MVAFSYAARGNLRRLLQLHPSWTRAQFAQATGMSLSWVDNWKKRLKRVLSTYWFLRRRAFLTMVLLALPKCPLRFRRGGASSVMPIKLTIPQKMIGASSFSKD